MTYVPFTVKMTEDQITDKLKSLYGTEFTAADIKAFVAMNDITYQTVTRKLQKYKVSKGKWNLEVTQKVVDKIEKHSMHLQQKLEILFQIKMTPLLSLEVFLISKR